MRAAGQPRGMPHPLTRPPALSERPRSQWSTSDPSVTLNPHSFLMNSFASGFTRTPGKKILYLTKDAELLRRQIAGELTLTMDDVRVEDLLDDINTDAMTPAWVCFDYEPEAIARNAYAGLIVDGKRIFEEGALMNGGFEIIVSGQRKGVGSSRETAVQAEKWCGIRLAIAESFAPIHARNNINQGVLMGDHDLLRRIEAGETIPLDDFMQGRDEITQSIIRQGGLFKYARALQAGEIQAPKVSQESRPLTMAEKILAKHAVGASGNVSVKPGDAVLVRVDGGYSHEFTTAQVHHFLAEEYGDDYTIPEPDGFAVFEDHLIYADDVPRMARFLDKIEVLRDLQRKFQQHTKVRDFSAQNGVSPGICHQVAREHIILPGQIIVATDSHTCMGGSSNALAWGVGATEYANLVHSGFTFARVPESIRFELHGELDPGCTAKDIMLYILWKFAREQKTLGRCMEFAGPGLRGLTLDERATLANMATECTAFTGIVEADEVTAEWIAERRPELSKEQILADAIQADEGAEYAGGVHRLDLGDIRPMVANPGDPDRGIPSDPTNGEFIGEMADVPVDIAYGGSCTAGKADDIAFYAKVLQEADAAGQKVADSTKFYLQFGSKDVHEWAKQQGYLDLFQRTGVQVISPGCGACIGCGPGVSDDADQVTVSAINRNYKGRSGPGRLYLASPLTVAASAITGSITAYRPGMFAKEPAAT